jgi:hypothetical protein
MTPCHYAECRAECRDLSIGVVMLNFVMLSVVAPYNYTL